MASSSLQQLEQAHEERVSALLPALHSATLACSRRCVDRTDRAALPDTVVLLVSSFLDFARPQFWSIPRACGRHEGALGDLRLLQRLVARESRDLDVLYRAHLFNQALVNAVENRSLDVVQWLCTTYLPTGAATAAMEKASEKGELEIMQWLGEHTDANIVWNPRFMDAAAGNNHLHLLRWLERHPKNAGCTRNAMNRAVEQGHLEVVKWLHERYPDVRSYNALPLAARSGHLEVAKFLHEHGHNLPRELDCAVESGKLEMIQWFYHDLQITNCSTAGMDFAARSGNLEVLKWLHLRSWHGCSEFAMNWAVVNGHLDVAQWLHENRIEGCSDFVVSLVAQEGHLDGIQWLYEHRQECISSDVSNTIQCAAAKGHLHVMEWVCEHFEGWSFHSSMDLAAENGHLEVLKWLHEHGARCSAAAMDLAACNNHLEVVKWLHANRLEGCTVRAMDRAARAGYIEIVKWLHMNRSEGCTTAAMDTAGSCEMLRWLHENRSEGCTTAAMENAVKNGDFDAVLFLHTNRQEGCSTEIVEAIAQSKTENVALLQWLYENYRDMLDLDVLRTELALSYHPVRYETQTVLDRLRQTTG